MAKRYTRKTDVDTRPPGKLVDAQPAMDHVRMLVGKGMTILDIIERTGLTSNTIHSLFSGVSNTHQKNRPVRRCVESTEKIILDLEFEPSWDPASFRPEKFRGAREAQGLSRRTLGRTSGLCSETIQYWENGRSLPKRLSNLNKALRALNLRLEDVTGPVEDEPSEEASDVEWEYTPDPVADVISDYPCGVCGGIFRSRTLLATHPHARKKADAQEATPPEAGRVGSLSA
jgi:transcriptional regulator with XRE-family HTH domain